MPLLATGGRHVSVQNDINMLKTTALHWAAGHSHREEAELPRRHGADVHSKFDKTPFDIPMDTSNTDVITLLQVEAKRVGMGRDKRFGKGRRADIQTELKRGKQEETKTVDEMG